MVSLVLAAASIDGWVVARFIGGRGIDSTWQDPVFGRSLVFYFFELPFYTQLIGFLEVCAAAGAVVYYVTARVWQMQVRFPELWSSGQLNWDDLRRLGRLETGMFKVLLAFFLVGLAAYFWLGRYELLYTDHGELMTGVDYVQQHIGLPLQTAKAVAALLAAALVLAGRRKLALACALVLVVDAVLPPAINALQVRPNELALQRPFIERHIEATRSAYGLNRRARESEFPARKDAPIDFKRNASMLDNVRLWDWQAFHDTLSQSQPLRPYAYADTDVDRYQIDGQMRQVLLAPRELDLSQLGDAQSRWVISHTIYTHGYGLALAEASRISPSGLPELLIRNAPVEVLTPSLKLTRPEIYYGEESRRPGVRPDHAARVQLSFRLRGSAYALRRAGRNPGRFHGSAAGLGLGLRRPEHRALRCVDFGKPDDDPARHSGAARHAGSVPHLGSRCLYGDRRRRAPGVDRGWVHHQRGASLLAADSGRRRRRVQLHPQLDQGHRGRL